MITGITKVTHISTKQDMSRWTRAHSDTPGITWSVLPGPGGTMIIVEHEEDRCSLTTADLSPDAAATPDAVVTPDAAVTADGPAQAPIAS